MIDLVRLRNAYEAARDDLLSERVSEGHWVGELSGSALSTATALSALGIVASHTRDGSTREACRQLTAAGMEWISRCRNDDGGWGDTDKSYSNIAATMLVRAAVHLAGAARQHAEMLAKADDYTQNQDGIAALRRRYGKDKTFAVPILTNCALAGLVPWSEVAPLPFELACLPYWMLRFLRLPVVSYAIPALVAVGQAHYFNSPPRNPFTKWLRRLAIGRSLRTLQRMQPASGGFLEAVPLTSFVIMTLAATGRADHDVVRRGVRFLARSVRADGCWPIDVNLATWNTTLAINALASASGSVGALSCLDWLLSCQHQVRHPFTDAAPGGWGWSDLSGAVPDVDDTAAALLALGVLRASGPEANYQRIDRAAARGVKWLLNIQNADGGWPTFCRGWGALPFDRSAADLTAHALRALWAWRGSFGSPQRVDAAVRRGLQYLADQQRPDGSWVPLWFGNQDHPHEINPVYGTARVVLAYRDLGRLDSQPARRGLAWLTLNRCLDGGWGAAMEADADGSASGVSSIEEMAIAVEALLADDPDRWPQPAVDEGLAWLVAAVEAGRHREPAPIGFYFAKLWYYERLYPLTFTVSALGRALRRLTPSASGSQPF